MFSAISARFSSAVAQAAKKAKPKPKPAKKPTKKSSSSPRKAKPKSEMEPLANPHPTIPEINGPVGKEPTRFGDWENKGRTSDF